MSRGPGCLSCWLVRGRDEAARGDSGCDEETQELWEGDGGLGHRHHHDGRRRGRRALTTTGGRKERRGSGRESVNIIRLGNERSVR